MLLSWRNSNPNWVSIPVSANENSLLLPGDMEAAWRCTPGGISVGRYRLVAADI